MKDFYQAMFCPEAKAELDKALRQTQIANCRANNLEGQMRNLKEIFDLSTVPDFEPILRIRLDLDLLQIERIRQRPHTAAQSLANEIVSYVLDKTGGPLPNRKLERTPTGHLMDLEPKRQPRRF